MKTNERFTTVATGRMAATRGLRALIVMASTGVLSGVLPGVAFADEAVIRKNIAARLPNFPAIDEVSKSPIPGVWEVRVGTDVIYTDANGDHVIQGSITDTKTRTNLTQARIDKLTAINFATLPIKDAMVVKQGNGARKMAVFADPNCGYCKRFEQDLMAVKDVTIYTFIYPILGEDSTQKSQAIWCTKDAMATWRAWMINGKTPSKHMGKCDTAALERNIAFGQKHRVTGTPAVLFEDGKRVPGAMGTAQIEKALADATKGKPKS